MFEAYTAGSSYSLDNIRRIESTWQFSEWEIAQELEKMRCEELVACSVEGYWNSTRTGLHVREQRLQERGLRHSAILRQDALLPDLVLAIVASGHELIEIFEYATLSEDSLHIYLWRLSPDSIYQSLEKLIEDKWIKRDPTNKKYLLLTANGKIEYYHKVVPRLGLIPPQAILAAMEQESPRFNSLSLPSNFTDNLHYRWEEKRLSAAIKPMLG